jgi:two-component system sensor histidine kinase/response regulator
METARRLSKGRAAPRIVLVNPVGQDAAEPADAGIDATLTKPMSQSSLVDAVMGLFVPHAGQVASTVPALGATEALRKVRFLLAEDNEINQQIARELLESAGARVEIANNGREAVEMLAANPGGFDAVLMDLQMPEMGGIEATRLVRADAGFANLPIIAMTAHAMVEERERCLAAGMVDHITKPIDPRAMFQTLSRWVGGVQGPAEREADLGDLPHVEGLDAAAGLKRAGSNRALYLDLLRQFAERHADASARIAQALAAKDRPAAERIAHAVRGVAANIGLATLAASAKELEQALSAGREVRTVASHFEAALVKAVASLGSALAEMAPEAPGAAGDAAGGEGEATRLAELLAASDGEALDHFERSTPALRALIGETAFGELSRAITNYDFKEARDVLEEAAGRNGVNLSKDIA